MPADQTHGRHWYFLAIDGEAQGRLREIYAQMMGGEYVSFQHDDVVQLIDPDGDLRCSFLLKDGQFAAGYPMPFNGHGWPIRVNQAHPWDDGCQGQVTGSCCGAAVTLFDTQFFQNQPHYAEESEHTFIVAALGYQLFETVFADDEQAEQLSQTKAYFPIGDDGAIDEFKFMSHVEAVREVDFHGVPLRAYTVTIALPDDFEMRLDVYAPPVRCEKEFEVGDPISGFAWLFGTRHSGG